jgi:hypothetical protein
MKSVHYVAKEDAQFFLDALRDQMDKLTLAPLGKAKVVQAVLDGEMHMVVALEDRRIMGAMIIQDRQTKHGLTAFIYAYFGRDVTDKAYYDSLAALLRKAKFKYVQGFGKPSTLKMYEKAGLPLKEERKVDGGVFFGAKL